MRDAFVKGLCALAKQDERILLLTGDLGFKVFDQFRADFPTRFINVGVAEGNLIGLAAGLSLEGKIPFVYSIASFLTMRPYEQIRNDICFHHANVKLIGVGGGYSYGPNGATHHALNDVAILRSLPEMSVLSPGDPKEVEWAIGAAYHHQGPVYVRLGRAGEPCLHKQAVNLAWGKAMVMSQGADIALLATGLILPQAQYAAAVLSQQGHSVRLVSFPSIKPLDHQAIAESFNCEHVFTLEEHFLAGGFGSAVLEVAMQKGLNTAKMQAIAAKDHTFHETGSHAHLRQLAGLSVPQIVEAIVHSIQQRLIVPNH